MKTIKVKDKRTGKEKDMTPLAFKRGNQYMPGRYVEISGAKAKKTEPAEKSETKDAKKAKN